MKDNLIQSLELEQNDNTNYPYNIPAVKQIKKLRFNSPVTFIIGENGIGKLIT